MTAFIAVLKRDLTILHHTKSRLLYAPAFFIVMTTLFPLSIGPSANQLVLIAPGLLVLAALLAGLLTQESLYKTDIQSGTLDVIAVDDALLPYVNAKICLHWILSGLPLLAASPLAVIMLGLPSDMMSTVVLYLLPLTLSFALIGTLIASLTVGARRTGMLLAFLALPLYIPVLIFGAGGLMNAATGIDGTAPVLLIWAFVALAIPLVPLVAAALLKDKLQ